VVEFKGRGTYSSALAADGGGRFDFWNLGRSYTVILKRYSPYFVQCEWGYI
jgi:hypothetical protein